MNITISDKTYNGIYRKIKGSDLKSDIALYNDALVSAAKNVEEMYFLVFTDHEQIRTNEEYLICGFGDKKYFMRLISGVNFVYLVNLIDDELYYQNSRAGCVLGKVTEIKKYKFNFEITDVEKKKNTFLNLVELIGYNTDNFQLESYAVDSLNKNLLENIFRYKKTFYDTYSDNFRQFKSSVIKRIKITNPYRYELLRGVQEINNLKELMEYVKRNKIKFRDNSDLLYTRNDNIKNSYPINMVGTNVTLNLFDGLDFNSALPFYFQYRNYRQSTEILSEYFFEEIISKEQNKIKESLIKYDKYRKNEEYESVEIDTTAYGLYFPLLMSFRQSIELAYKLIFVNENLKKQIFTTRKELKNYVEIINTHDLIDLLKQIESYLDGDVQKFLLELSSFIFYNEGTDASFSRYLVDKDLDFDFLKPITIYYIDLYHYINEFYQVMDEVFGNMNFGFDLRNVFTR